MLVYSENNIDEQMILLKFATMVEYSFHQELYQQQKKKIRIYTQDPSIPRINASYTTSKLSLEGAVPPSFFITGAILTRHFSTSSRSSCAQTLGPSNTAG
jgi:hypothetical protein